MMGMTMLAHVTEGEISEKREGGHVDSVHGHTPGPRMASDVC